MIVPGGEGCGGLEDVFGVRVLASRESQKISYAYSSTSRLCSSKQTLILGAPGGALAAFATLASGWYSDRKVKLCKRFLSPGLLS